MHPTTNQAKLDAAKGYLAARGLTPAVAAARSRHRLATANLQRSFNAARVDRLTESWLTVQGQIREELRSDLDALRTRARDAELNNDFMRRFLELAETNIIGDQGPQLISTASDGRTPDQLASDAIEAGFTDWSCAGICEVSGQLSFLDLCNSIIRGTARDGECLVQEILGADAGNAYGYALRVIDVARIATWHNREASPGQAAIRCGVELSAVGAPVAIWITESPVHRAATRVPIDTLIHRYRHQFAEQPRGIPWAHAALLSMHFAGEFALSALVAAKAGADNLGFFVSPDGAPPPIGDPDGADPAGPRIATSASGTWDTLPAGYDVKVPESKYPNEVFDPFIKSAHRRMAAGLNVSYPTLCNDYADLNYNSIRATQQDDRDQWRKYQAWFKGAWLDRIFSRWLRMALAAGALTMPNGSALPAGKIGKFSARQWQFRGWESNDPLKDIAAFEKERALGVNSSTAYARARGRDVETIATEQQAEEALFARPLGPAQNPQAPGATPQ